MIAHLKAFDILSADIHDEIDIGTEIRCGLEMRDCFDDAEINAETGADEVLAVAGDSRCADMQIGIHFGIDLFELLDDAVKRLSAVRGVILIEQLALVGDEYELCRCRAGVDAEIRIARCGMEIGKGQVMCLVPIDECFIFAAAAEQRLARDGIAARGCIPDPFERLGKLHRADRLCGIHCAAVCNENRRIFREDRVLFVELQRPDECLPQSLEEGKRAAEEQNSALDRSALCETGNGLIDDCLKDARGDVLALCALIEQRLDIGFCENAAA